MKMRITAIVLIAALMCTTASLAKDFSFTGSGSGSFIMIGSTFGASWGATNGSVAFGIYGPNMSYESIAASNGSMGGSFSASSTHISQGFTAIDRSRLQSLAQLPDGSFAAVAFDGTGFINIRISAGDLLGKTAFLCSLDADAFWIFIVVDEEPETEPHEPAPFLVFTAVGFKDRKVRMVIENTGDASTEGCDANVFCGLSYNAMNWWSESITHFKLETYEDVVIEPGQTVAFDFSMPTSIPPRQISSFMNRRGLFTSYNYPNPTTDCFDFTLRIDVFSFHCFSPTTIRFE